MGFGLLGYDVAYYAALYDLSASGYLILVNKKACVGALDILDSLVKSHYLISKCSCPFWFVGPFHQVPLFLGFSGLWEYCRVHPARLDRHVSFCIVGVCLVFSCFLELLCMD